MLDAKFISLIHHSRSLTEIVVDSNQSNVTFDLDPTEGWVFRLMLDGTRRRVCWLPHKRRDRGEIAWDRHHP
jgi:SH3-like domain-containing protein